MNIFLYFIKFLFLPIVLLCCHIVDAQNIVVPATDKTKTSPFLFSTSTSKDGESIYEKNCLSCHGNPGKGNGLKGMNPPPADLGTAKSQNQTDGELFYKISEGNPVMPKFKTILSVEERWKIISFIRSLNSKYVQPALKKNPENLLSKAVHIDMGYDLISNRITLTVTANVKSKIIPLKGSEVLLFVKRYFGTLQIGNSISTNDQGIATFDFPKNLHGDKNGTLEVISRINDNVYGEIITSRKVKIGKPTKLPGLTEKRAMWNVAAKAPIWLLATFFSIVIGVWSTIGYIIFNIFKIKKLSSKINN